MKYRLIKRILKITGWILLILVVVLGYVLYSFTSPKSDKEIRKEFSETAFKPFISRKIFNDKEVRLISMQESIDTILPTLVFVHGSPGSAMDFQRYLKDSTLNKLANIVSFDRIGYGSSYTGEVLESLEEEVKLLHELLGGLKTRNVILVGYSYGGTVVMASEKDFKKKIILAAAVKGDLEPMFWALNLYKWNFSRPFIPKVFRAASLEKLRHVDELPAYENKWTLSPSQVVSIHGKEDFIVPYENSLFLQQIFEAQQFSLIPLEEGNHSLIWTNFDIIKAALIKSIQE